jgi:DNA-binding phage protein
MNKPESVRVVMDDSFPAELEKLAQRYGGISALARYLGIDRANLHKVVRDKRPPSPTLLNRMGAIKRIAYVIRVVWG